MKIFLDLIKLIPAQLQIGLACLVIGGLAFAGLETRYMTVSDYTKSRKPSVKFRTICATWI
jgi:hypothetical protein